MQWLSDRIEQYISNPEFFDTAVIPCYRISLALEGKAAVKAIEVQMARVLELEDRLKGRIVLFPAIVVFGTDDAPFKNIIDATSIAMTRFKYVIYAPFDESLAALLQEQLKNNNGMMLSANDRVDWFTEIVDIWNKK